MTTSDFKSHIHLLYVPTLACNLGCRYCYLGDQTRAVPLQQDSQRAAATLRQALDSFLAAGVLPFNVSLHGGEPTMLPPAVLEELFGIIRQHYRDHFDELSARGFRKSAPHIKTNLYNFHSLYELFERQRVSISASIDLPLSLHGQYRTTKAGESWLPQTLDNLRLLARYPHAAKISATLYREHLQDLPALIGDIWRIHREIGFDMNKLNFMFGFEAADRVGEPGALRTIPDVEQVRFYEVMRAEFLGTELEEGLLRNWFDEFKPYYCTNAFNCGERFLLLQSDGEVYSCVRGQGLEACRYGNILQDPLAEILAAGRSKIALLHQQAGLDQECAVCRYLHICHTGCPVVKRHSGQSRSYTCALQKALYRDQPRCYPALPEGAAQKEAAREYTLGMHPALAVEQAAGSGQPVLPRLLLPNDLADEKNALRRLIAADPVLEVLYSQQAIQLEINGALQSLRSQILKEGRDLFSLGPDDRIALHIQRSFFQAGCPELIRNTLHLQMLRDTAVVYGDEQRTKQEHLFNHQIFYSLLAPSPLLADGVMADLSALLRLHQGLYLKGVLNNLFVTSGYLREYHYQKQKGNAFYHIQAINLPFQNVEFYWD